jgi:hypothetical protein
VHQESAGQVHEPGVSDTGFDGGDGGVYSGAVKIVREKPERYLAAVASWRGETRAKRVRRAA